MTRHARQPATRRAAVVLMVATLALVACGDDDSSTVASTADAGTGAGTAAAVDANLDTCVDEFDADVDYFPDKVEAEHATEWDVDYYGNYKVISVNGVQVGDVGVVDKRYVLVQCGTPTPALTGDLEGAGVFEVPISTVVDGGGAVLGGLEVLGLTASLVGWRNEPGGVENLPNLAARAEAGDISEIGDYGSSPEPIVELDPDLFISYDGPDEFAQYESVGIPVVYFSPFGEDGLGAAEQVNWLSLWFNAEAAANEFFEPIEARYIKISEQSQAQPEQPTVLIGHVDGDGNFGSGRFNPVARASRLVTDAGGVDLLADLTPADQSFSQVSLEQAVEIGADADFWFLQSYDPVETTAADFIAANPQNAQFPALERGDAFHRFGRSEDYFNSGAVYADELLADMVSILHPELLPDHELVWLERVPA
jgi:iron complex transport system substrate-binding protein